MTEGRIFGHMRFSYLGRSDVKLARLHEDPAERAAALYDPARMEERFHFFERLCLPSIRWQSDPDFRLAIFTSPEMPEPYQARLAHAVSAVPQIEIVQDSAAHITHAVTPWIARQDVAARARTLHFRLDDDDALATDFIATLREHLDRVPGDAIITRASGLYLADTDGGPELLAKFDPYVAVGFAVVNEPGRIHNPYALRHRIHHQNVPSLVLPGPFAYIHAAHAHSDTREAQLRMTYQARADHQRLFGNRPRRFRQGVRAQFNGLRVEHFLRIANSAPSRRAARNEKAPE